MLLKLNGPEELHRISRIGTRLKPASYALAIESEVILV
jgi:hypothetical protein